MKTTGPGDLPVQAHLFEYTTSFALTPEYAYDFGAKGKAPIMPCQIMFCLKEKNAKKVNSHRWFFNAFAPLLQPNGESLLSGSDACRARAEPLVIPTSLCSARRRYDPRTQVDLPAVEGL